MSSVSMKKLSVSLLLVLAAAASPWASAGTKQAVMFKPLHCGCCDDYAEYLERNGFEVEVKALRSLAMTKRLAGVPERLEGCHTLLVDGYTIDGLVPIATVNRLLTERPDI